MDLNNNLKNNLEGKMDKKFPILSLIILFLVTVQVYAQSSSSLHLTRKGKTYFYSSTNGGFEQITNIPMSALRCLRCHPGKLANGTPVDTSTYQPSCNDCHNFTVGTAVPDSICKRCHSRQKVEIANYTDKHRTLGFNCTTCHIKDELHMDATNYFTMFDTTAGKNCQTSGCHNNLPITTNDSLAHAIHLNKLECPTCHTRSEVTCYNCHFETELWSGMRGYKRPIGQLKGFIMLGRHTKTGKVGLVNYQSIVYQGQSFVAYGPYYAHTIMPKDSTRACNACHNAATIQEFNNTGYITVARWDSTQIPKIVHTQGMIPIPPNYQSVFKFDFANYVGRIDTTYTNPNQWVFLKSGANLQQMLSIYVQPLTTSQMQKLGATIGINPIGTNVPEKYVLYQNYPNPFNPSTNIKFSIPENKAVTLKVYNTLGKEVVSLLNNEPLRAGEYMVTLNAGHLPSGVYFYRLVTDNYSKTMKMMLVK